MIKPENNEVEHDLVMSNRKSTRKACEWEREREREIGEVQAGESERDRGEVQAGGSERYRGEVQEGVN